MAVEKLSLLALNETPELLSALFTCYPDLYPGFTAFNFIIYGQLLLSSFIFTRYRFTNCSHQLW